MEVVVTGFLQTRGHLILCIKSLDEERERRGEGKGQYMY